MNLQYIIDSNGETTGVFIPIREWNDLKSKFSINEEGYDVPDWHKNIVRERIKLYKNNPGLATDFDTAIDEIEREL